LIKYTTNNNIAFITNSIDKNERTIQPTTTLHWSSTQITTNNQQQIGFILNTNNKELAILPTMLNYNQQQRWIAQQNNQQCITNNISLIIKTTNNGIKLIINTTNNVQPQPPTTINRTNDEQPTTTFDWTSV